MALPRCLGCMPSNAEGTLRHRPGMRMHLMLTVLAPSVVSQDFYDPTSGHPLAVAIHDGSELVSKGYQAFDLAVHFMKMCLCNLMKITAGAVWITCETEKLPDGFDFEPEFTSMPDEVQPVDIIDIVTALLSPGSGRRGEKTDLLIIADRRYLHASPAGQLANREIHWKNSLEAIVSRGQDVG